MELILDKIMIQAVVWFYVKHALGLSVLPPDLHQTGREPLYLK